MFSGHWTHLNDFWFFFWSLGTLEWLLKDDWHTQWLVLSDGHWCGHVYFVNTGPVLPWHLEVSTKNHCQQLGLMGWHQVNKETAKKYKMPYWSQKCYVGQHPKYQVWFIHGIMKDFNVKRIIYFNQLKFLWLF